MGESITIVGNVGVAPDRREISPGVWVTNFTVGCTTRRYDKQAEAWVDAYTNWYHVSAYRALSEPVYQSVHRGDPVIVSGTLRMRSWETDAKKGTTAEIDAVAVGHNLARGTAVFTRSSRSDASAPSADTDPAAWTQQPAPVPF
jgi:single-strand DNA-binding protein